MLKQLKKIFQVLHHLLHISNFFRKSLRSHLFLLSKPLPFTKRNLLSADSALATCLLNINIMIMIKILKLHCKYNSIQITLDKHMTSYHFLNQISFNIHLVKKPS